MMKFFQSQVDKRQQKLRQEDCEFEISLDCKRRWCLRRTQTTKKKPTCLTSGDVCVLCVCVSDTTRFRNYVRVPWPGRHESDTGRGEAKTLLGAGQGAGREGRLAIYKNLPLPGDTLTILWLIRKWRAHQEGVRCHEINVIIKLYAQTANTSLEGRRQYVHQG